MRSTRAFYLLLFLTSFFHFCKISSPAEYDKSKIHFGSGGGFTGAVTSFYLLQNGQLFEKPGMDTSFQELDKIPKSEASALFDRFEALQFRQLDYNQPGNLYHFLAWGKKEEQHRITWGQGDSPLNTEQKEFYNQLYQLVERQSDQ